MHLNENIILADNPFPRFLPYLHANYGSVFDAVNAQMKYIN